VGRFQQKDFQMENLSDDRTPNADPKDGLGAKSPEDNREDTPATDDQVDRDIAAACEAAETADKSDAQWIEHLAKRWRGHLKAGLELRFETGQAFNKRFGSPEVRFPRGEGIAELLAEQTGISVADISRFRWFAHHFSSFADFQAKQPKVTTWARVKVLLVELAPKTGKKVPTPTESSPQSEVQTVLQNLRSVTEALQEHDVKLDEDSTEDLAVSLRKLGRALKGATGFELSVSFPKGTLDD
jgi:hypothetical protein